MKPFIYYLLIFLLFFSCKSNSDKTSVIYNKNLERIANKYYLDGKYPQAKKAYDSLIQIDSSVGQFYARRAYCLVVQGKFDSAKKNYLQALRFDYEDKKDVYFSLGLIEEFYIEYDTALFYFNKSIEEDPNYLRAKQEKDKMIKLLKMKRININ